MFSKCDWFVLNVLFVSHSALPGVGAQEGVHFLLIVVTLIIRLHQRDKE